MPRARKTVNAAGGEAYEMSKKSRLVTGVLTTFFNEPKYYGDTSKDIVKTAREMVKEDPQFVAKLACYSRNEFHMRTISQVLAAEVAHGAKGNPITRRMTKKVVERPDDMTNILAYYFDTFGARKMDGKKNNPVTRGLVRGIGDIFEEGRFDEYQLAKYKGVKNVVKLRDALLLARPKPKDKNQAELFKRLIENTLATPETRETVLSQKGQSKEVWEDLIERNRMGYFACIRNLKNFLEQGVSKTHLSKVANYISNEKAVAGSKLLPFRFYTAYKQLDFYTAYKQLDNVRGHSGVAELKAALEQAMSHSVKNLPRLDGITYMTADESGSMTSPLSKDGMIRQIDVGNLLMAMGAGFCEQVHCSAFGDKHVSIKVPNDGKILKNAKMIENEGRKAGWSTRLDKVFSHLVNSGTFVDRIIVFSDMQAYENSLGGYYGKSNKSCQTRLTEYKKKVNPKVWLHSIDLSGYGTSKVCQSRVNEIAGWSEKVFDFIKLSEEVEGDLIQRIESYEV